MKIFRICLLFFLVILILGCATSGNYQQALNQMHGTPFHQVAARWGCPAASTQLPNGNRLYLYSRHQFYTTPPPPTTAYTPFVNVNGTPMATTAFTGNLGGWTRCLYCNTWFEVNSQGLIVSSQFQGNNCIANCLGGGFTL